jgi:hypothetical protein
VPRASVALKVSADAPVGNPDGAFQHLLEGVNFQPVFIIGPHRSGTTILYKVLLESGCFNGVTAYHIVNQNRLLSLHQTGRESQARAELVRLFESKGLKDREFDSMKISPDLPEEYCFAFKHQGRRPVLSPDNVESFTEFCRKLQFVQQRDRPLLLKNPFETVNFVPVAKAFPAAKFVFIYRHPAEVINSHVKGIRGILEKKNEYVAMVWERYRQLYENPTKLALARALYCGRSPFLYWHVRWNIAHIYDYVVNHADTLGSSAIGLTYNELCERPNESIASILRFLGVCESAPRDYRQFIQPRISPLLRDIERDLPAIEQRNSRYLKQFGISSRITS